MGTVRTTQRGTIDTTVPGQSVNLHNPGGSHSVTSKPVPEAQEAQDAADTALAEEMEAHEEVGDLSALTKAELLAEIERRGIEGYSSKNNKAELIAALS